MKNLILRFSRIKYQLSKNNQFFLQRQLRFLFYFGQIFETDVRFFLKSPLASNTLLLWRADSSANAWARNAWCWWSPTRAAC